MLGYPQIRQTAIASPRIERQTHGMRDGLLERIAANQEGVVTWRQARESGLSEKAITAHLHDGRWQKLYPRVYAIHNGPITRMAQFWAAILYCGKNAVISHESAAELYRLHGRKDASNVHITIPSKRRVDPRPGLVVHRSAHLTQTRHPTHYLPRTRIEDTVIDLTQRSDRIGDAMAWLASAVAMHHTTAIRLVAAIKGRHRVKWRAELLEALVGIADGCHSLLELRYRNEVEIPHGLPHGRRQVRRVQDGKTIYDDVAYPEWNTLMELDGRIFHQGERRNKDRRRDNASVLEGKAVLRYTWADVCDNPCETAAQVAKLLQRQGWSGSPVPCGPTCPIGSPRANC